MGEVIAAVDVLPPAIKAGWLLWMAWAAAQVVWYRRAHGVAARVAQPAVAPPVARRRPETRPESRPDTRPEARPDMRSESGPDSHGEPHPASHLDARSAAAAAPPSPTLPAIDLSDISAFAERPERASRVSDTPPPASILGLDPRPSTN